MKAEESTVGCGLAGWLRVVQWGHAVLRCCREPRSEVEVFFGQSSRQDCGAVTRLGETVLVVNPCSGPARHRKREIAKASR